MLPIDPTTAAMLATSIRVPRVYISCQIPAITNATTGTIDPTKLGSQFLLTNCTGLHINNQIEVGADTADFTLDNTSGSLTPIAPSMFSRYFYPGNLDNKYQIYIGLESQGTEVVYPKGTYVSSTTAQQSAQGVNTLTVNCLDQFSMFTGNVYTRFLLNSMAISKVLTSIPIMR